MLSNKNDFWRLKTSRVDDGQLVEILSVFYPDNETQADKTGDSIRWQVAGTVVYTDSSADLRSREASVNRSRADS